MTLKRRIRFIIRTLLGTIFTTNVIFSLVTTVHFSSLSPLANDTVLWFINAGIWMLVLLVWICYTEDS